MSTRIGGWMYSLTSHPTEIPWNSMFYLALRPMESSSYLNVLFFEFVWSLVTLPHCAVRSKRTVIIFLVCPWIPRALQSAQQRRHLNVTWWSHPFPHSILDWALWTRFRSIQNTSLIHGCHCSKGMLHWPEVMLMGEEGKVYSIVLLSW